MLSFPQHKAGNTTDMIIDTHQGSIKDGKVFTERASYNTIFIHSQNTTSQITHYRRKSLSPVTRSHKPLHDSARCWNNTGGDSEVDAQPPNRLH